METLIQIVVHTPAWVYAVLAYGLFMGIRSLWPRRMSVRYLFVLPVVLFGLSSTFLVSGAGPMPIGAIAWVAALAAGIAVGWSVLSAKVLSVDREHAQMTVGRNGSVLVLFILIFGGKYFYGIMRAVNPALAAQPAFALAVMAISGFSTGIMIGRIVKLYVGYFTKRRALAA